MSQTPGGYFRLELNTFETKMFDLGNKFSDNIGEVKIDFSKKKITASVMDDAEGSVFKFLAIVAGDEQRVLRIKYGDPVGYTLEFTGTEVDSHTFNMGDSFEIKRSLLAISGIGGMSFNNSPMQHKIVFSYKDKIVK